MGGANGKLSNDELKVLMQKTKYSNSDVTQLYKDFKDSTTVDKKQGFTYEEFAKFFGFRFKEWTPEAMKSMFNCFDSDGNGILDFKEFTIALYIMTKSPVKEKLDYIFDIFDADKSGYLDPSEISKLVANAITCGSALGMGEDDSFEYAHEILSHSKISDKKRGLSKTEFIDSASSSDKFCRMICFYDSVGNLLY